MSWNRFEPEKDKPYGMCSCDLAVESREAMREHLDSTVPENIESSPLGPVSKHRVTILNRTRAERIAAWVRQEAESAARWHSDVDYLDGMVIVHDEAYEECAGALMRAVERGEVGVDEITQTSWPDSEFSFAWLQLVEEKFPEDTGTVAPPGHPTLELSMEEQE